MLNSCCFLVEFSASKSLQDLRDNRAFRSAVERELQIIGEAMMVLAKVAPDVAAAITDSARIIRLRHVLVHGYDKIDQDVLWNVVTVKLSVLQTELDRCLTQLDQPREDA